jgi:hypothetical protein
MCTSGTKKNDKEEEEEEEEGEGGGKVFCLLLVNYTTYLLYSEQ